MKILAIGDIFAQCGVEHTSLVLRSILSQENIDFCIANAENASGTGISFHDYDELTDAGVDFFTLGNHAFGRKDVLELFEREPNIIRPANFHSSNPGKGSCVVSVCGKKIGIINIMGRVGINISLNCPFEAVDREIDALSDKCDFFIVDFHAEATSEKLAMKYHLDSRVSVLFGTHTHVQTADDCVTGQGMGYITDLGMTGAVDSILGVKKDIILSRFIKGYPQKFEYAYGRASLNGAIFTIDEKTNLCTKIKRISVV